MNETLNLLLAWVAGILLGSMFFGGLWWTLRKGLASKQAALWFFSSMLLRMSLALAGFHFVSGGHWERLLSCLVGFILARLIVMRLVRSAEKQTGLAQETQHAS